MQYFSLNRKAAEVNFKEATIRGQAPDKGLYFPSEVPQLDKAFVNNISVYSNEEIAFRVIRPYTDGLIPEDVLFGIISETVNFPVPLIPVNENIFSLELFHGNTLAFKDIGARFMSRCLAYFVKDYEKKVIVLVATSGDTGSAVADGFYGAAGVEVVILYPSGKVSTVQEKQLTTYDKNIHAIEVKGTFDDCQRLVKQAFSDNEMNKYFMLTSANSINVARWLPQQFFYFFAYKEWADKDRPPVVCVPSGNFGNICAGLLAKKSGLPFGHFIAACNANDVIPRFLENQVYKPVTTIATISNAMDVGDPNNFVRIMELFGGDIGQLKKELYSYSISDDQTRSTLLEVYKEFNYLLDPHAAVAYAALEYYRLKNPGEKGILFETAHPVKFYDVVGPLIKEEIEMPAAVSHMLLKDKNSTLIDVDYQQLKSAMQNML